MTYSFQIKVSVHHLIEAKLKTTQRNQVQFESSFLFTRVSQFLIYLLLLPLLTLIVFLNFDSI